MENQIQSDVQPNNLPMEPVSSASVLPPNSRSKMALITLLGLIVIAGLVFAGIQIGKGQTTKQQPLTEQPTFVPTVISPTTIPVEPSLSPNPTATWKTYRNKKFMYEFKYPQIWKVEIASETGTPNYGNWILDEQTPENEFLFEIGTSVSRSNEDSCMTFLDSKNEFIKTNIQINNINWTKYESSSSVFFKAFNSKLDYCIRFSINPLAQNKKLDILDQILSTFKFLE